MLSAEYRAEFARLNHIFALRQQVGTRQTKLMYHFNSDVNLVALNTLYKEAGETGRAGPQDSRVGLEQDALLVCGARLMRYDDSYWLLRNLCTLPAARQTGLASQLLQAIQNQPEYQPLITFPLPHLNAFYRRNGFHEIDITNLPTRLSQLLKQCRRRHKGIQAMACNASLR